MINVTITRYASGGIGPWNFLFYDAANQGCVTFNPVSGMSDQFGTITTVATFQNEACLLAADIKLYVESQALNPEDRCTSTVDVAIDNPCTFTVEGIFSEGFTFSVLPAPTGTYNYAWSWDPQVFQLSNPQAGSNTPFIDLELVSQTVPANTPISVIVADSFGCTRFLVLNYIFQPPVAYDTAVTLVCLPDGSRENNSVFLNVQSAVQLDWTTLAFGPTAAQIIIEHPYATNPLVPENWIKISVPSVEPAGTYTISYTVRDINGVLSTVGTITVIVPECDGRSTPIYIQDYTMQITDCNLIAGDTIDIDITNLVHPNGNINWGSFWFQDSGTNQTATIVGEDNGYDDVANPNVVYTPSTHIITYTIPALGVTDSFVWSIMDNDGNISNAPVFFIWLTCTAAPIANDDEAVVGCGESVIIDLIANDDANGGTIDPASIQIVTQPAVGSLIVPGDGTVIYYAPALYTGTVTFEYTVSNNNGGSSGQTGTSNTATVTIQVICGGENANITVCQ